MQSKARKRPFDARNFNPSTRGNSRPGPGRPKTDSSKPPKDGIEYFDTRKYKCWLTGYGAGAVKEPPKGVVAMPNIAWYGKRR